MIRGWTDSPLGPIWIGAEDDAMSAVGWGGAGPPCELPLLARAAEQLAEYFAGARRRFDLPLAPKVSPATRSVLAEMLKIPYGETRTYGDLARATGLSAQAVGQACGANPLPILIPCHRVLAANGLGGYSGRGGVETKVALLRLEGAAGLLI